MPENVSPERKRILHAYGANIHLYRPGEGSDGASSVRVRTGHANIPINIFTPTSIRILPTGKLITMAQPTKSGNRREGRITHFVSMLGTSGTFVGTTRRLKELNPDIRCISLQPDLPFHGIEGAKHMDTRIVPKIYDASLADEDLGIATEDCACHGGALWPGEEGLLVGISAGAAVVGCLKLRPTLLKKDEQAVVVTILRDSGDKYLSENSGDGGLDVSALGGRPLYPPNGRIRSRLSGTL